MAGVVALAGAEPSPRETHALAYAQQFTENFVRESCTQTDCQFIPEASHVEELFGNLTVELQGRRRMKTIDAVQDNEVTAKLVLQPHENASGAPGMYVLDFQFAVGRVIPYPTR